MPQTLQQSELDGLLFREWPRIQETRALGWSLPPSSTRQWVIDKEVHGYVTLDYQLHRNVSIPNAAGEGKHGSATLVEQYWAVRTRNGRQDPHWPPSLNVNVVHGIAKPVTVAHCESALRNGLLVRRAAYSASQGCFRDEKANCRVRTYVIGSAITTEAESFAAFGEFQDVRLHVARYSYSAEKGFQFEEAAGGERFWHVGLLTDEENRQFGEQFFLDAHLPGHGFEWDGLNGGPVYDRELGVTHHDGRVL